MKSICFFCHFHNGDIFHIKSFLRDITSQLDTKFYIAHPNNSIITADLDIEYINLPIYWAKTQNIPEETKALHEKHVKLLEGKEHTKFIETEDCFYINTWIGGYFSSDNEFNGECSLRGFHRMFTFIYDKINKKFNVNLKVKSVENYHPFVDYSKFNVSNVDKFLSENKSKKILVCNGPSLSGQTTYNTDMTEILEPLASNNQDKIFITTKKITTNINNIISTDDIIKSNTCDLNEISYISKFCYLIIGRNSGPFCFTLTDENINDENKTFLAYGDRETDSLPYGIEINSTFIFDYFSTIKELYNTILELL
jgi:hypothetical protein